MSRFFFALRAGNFLRILLASYVIASGIIILARPSTEVTILSFVVATGVALVTSLVIGTRVAIVLKGWERAAKRAANEDFNATMTRTVPTTWVPLRDALQLSRERLAESLSKAREEKAVLVSMLNAMTEGIIAIDANARILLVNRVALSVLGVPAMQSPEEYEGEYLVTLVRDPRLNELVDRVLATGRPMADDTEIHATRKVCSVSVAPVIENGRVRGVVAAISDQTALKQLERVRQDFVTNVSHELKTPIAAIRGWAETLNSGMFDVPEDLKEPVETIHRQSERLSDLVNDLMTLARVESSGVRDEGEMVDIKAVIEKVKQGLSDRLDEKVIELDVSVDPGAQFFPAGGKGMSYIIRNLLDNAVKYSEPSTTVWISTSLADDGEHQVLEVTDEGAGIERHHLARIFERFYRVDAGRSRELGGTGLGLSIVKNFATAFGGRVEVESEVGKGSTFRVIFPRIRVEDDDDGFRSEAESSELGINEEGRSLAD
jgi:two-component system phosphate regulon sensor histidine kinase PhoR